MTRRIVEHFAMTGETIERDMNEAEEAQADLDEQNVIDQSTRNDVPVVAEEPVDDLVEGEQP